MEIVNSSVSLGFRNTSSGSLQFQNYTDCMMEASTRIRVARRSKVAGNNDIILSSHFFMKQSMDLVDIKI